MTEYAYLLKGWWQKQDQYFCLNMQCSKDEAAQKNFMDKDKAYQFFACLNVEYDQVHLDIMEGRNAIPRWNNFHFSGIIE